jgi:hypothetical protein
MHAEPPFAVELLHGAGAYSLQNSPGGHNDRDAVAQTMRRN